MPDGTIIPAGIVRLGWAADASTPEAIDDARRMLDSSMTPPSRDQIEMWLVELSVITARRIDAPETEELRVAAYAGRLSDYPADVARAALLDHRWKFFPSWAELGEVCDQLVKPRRQMAEAMDRARRDAEERERKARALPTEAAATRTPEEAAEERRRTMRSARAIMDELRAGVEAEQAAEAARRAAAPVFNTQRPEAAE